MKARKLTKLKRQQQTCKVYELKIDKSKLSKQSANHLNQLFKEAKWFYNYCLSLDDVNNADTKAKSVPVKVLEEYENRDFLALKSGMKQGIKTRMFNSMSSLKALKQNGRRIGRLRFKSQINSIPLKQFNNTYYIDIPQSRIRVQGMKSWLKVRGLDQIPADSEIANAVLTRKAGDFFLKVTVYTNKVSREVPEQSIGIDFGCETQLTLSDGTKIQFQVPISKRIKKLDRKIMRRGKASNSKNKFKDRLKRQKAYAKLNNKKKDIRNKVVSAITNNFQYVCFQDESIRGWKAGGHGKKIQHSGIGGIISDLKHKSVTPLLVNKFFPSTQLCPECSSKNKHEKSERIYNCSCGYSLDRDIHAAKNIETEGLKQIPVGRREFTLTENTTSTFFNALSKIDGVKVSKLVR